MSRSDINLLLPEGLTLLNAHRLCGGIEDLLAVFLLSPWTQEKDVVNL
jgi:hypothetical protein